MVLRFTDNSKHLQFCPLALTRPISNLRFGILTIEETWVKLLNSIDSVIEINYDTEQYLSNKFPNGTGYDYLIAGNFKPGSISANALANIQSGDNLIVNGKWLATKGISSGNKVEIDDPEAIWLTDIWDMFQQNAAAINTDFKLLTEGRTSQQISTTNTVLNANRIFIEKGAIVECAILNGNTGPIYIGENAEIMEGAMIRGPFSLGNHATVKMGAKIYGATSIGMHCKVGGEISNSIFYAYSNKGHDGFLGNSLIGEWCNLGADTNSSNLKNNYGLVKLYDYESKSIKQTPLQFCGLIMGDHSKTGINTMLNTATTVGVSSNIFGADFPQKYIPSFYWSPNETFVFTKAIEVAENMMSRRKISLSSEEREILLYLSKS